MLVIPPICHPDAMQYHVVKVNEGTGFKSKPYSHEGQDEWVRTR